MTGARHDASMAQIRAADPSGSAWVMANAGSGKTRVLIDRVARLLLDGTPPARILCLTYTRTAAAEMQARLFERLGRWAMMEDAALQAELAALHETPPAQDAPALARARRLFAMALETPGGLKIQTIHAFCDAILRRFPLEAGTAPGFRVMDERSAALMLADLRDALALAAERGEDPAFDALATLVSDATLDQMIPAILHARALFARNTGREALARTLGADPSDSAEAILADVLAADGAALLARLGPALASGSANDVKAAAALSAARAAEDPATRLRGLERLCLYGDGAKEPFGPKTGKFPTAATRKGLGADAGALDALMERVAAGRARRLAAQALDRAVALNRFGRALLDAYEDRKAAEGRLDFEDLVARSRAMLSASAMAAWVLWKLDGGIDHILVDEAQDTSPAQWEVIAKLTEEALSGEGARDARRTVFAVGDLKQSIYSFQGARPRAFGEMRDHFRDRLRGMGDALTEVPLKHSFRTAPVILRLVDAVFEGAAAEGLADGAAVPEHLAFFEALPGRVELWPYLPRPEKSETGPWWRPMDAPAPEDPRLTLAGTLAAEIACWLEEGRSVARDPGEGGTRPMRPGDVLILVQKRDILARGLVRALKSLDVPVAGEDRLVLTRVLAVRDILALLRFLAVPADDLSLAAVLRSPLFGVSEAALFDLSHGREGSLWQALRRVGHPSVGVLTDLRDAAGYLRPHDLIERILTRHGGRAALIGRLGPEIEEAVDELLAQALAHEATEPAELTGFLHWIDATEQPVKREAEAGGDAVRVMTVHGAKGLESPVVILPDTGPRRGGRAAPVIGIGGQAFWTMPSAEAPETLDAAMRARRRDEEEERRRLLYVALTRAKSLLVVAGAGSETKLEDSWYGLVAAGMERLGARTLSPPEGLAGDMRALGEDLAPAAAGAARPVRAAPALPARALGPAPAAEPGPETLSPSSLGGAHAISGTEESPEALALGTAIHALLERLPYLPEAERAAAARLLAPPGSIGEMAAAETLELLAMPGAAEIFGPDSLAEVAVTAVLPELGGARIAGRIDRLAVTADQVAAIDVKSNRLVPQDPAGVPEGILRQMGAYRAALARIYPGKRASAAILWTRGPVLMQLPDALLDAALARAGTARAAGGA